MHVGEHRALWRGAFDPVERLCQVAVRRVRVAPQGVDDPAIKAV